MAHGGGPPYVIADTQIDREIDMSLLAGEENQYRQLVTDLRNDLSVEDPKYPPLRMVDTTGSRFYVPNLKYGDASVRVAIRRSDLYVIGFKGTQDKWFETRGPQKEIYGSKGLPFAGDYGSLKKAAHGRIIITASGFPRAITLMSNVTDPKPLEDYEIAKFLSILVVAFSESVRFDPIAEFVQAALPTRGTTIDESIYCVLKSWDKLSTLARKYLGHGDEEVLKETEAVGKSKVWANDIIDYEVDNQYYIGTVGAVRRAITIMKYE